MEKHKVLEVNRCCDTVPEGIDLIHKLCEKAGVIFELESSRRHRDHNHLYNTCRAFYSSCQHDGDSPIFVKCTLEEYIKIILPPVEPNILYTNFYIKVTDSEVVELLTNLNRDKDKPQYDIYSESIIKDTDFLTFCNYEDKGLWCFRKNFDSTFVSLEEGIKRLLIENTSSN